MKMIRMATVAAGVVGLSAVSFAQSSLTNLEYYFTLKGDSTPINTGQIGVAGKDGNFLEISVWARFVKAFDIDDIVLTPFDHNYVNVFLTTGTKVGDDPAEQTFSLGGDMMSAVANAHGQYDASQKIVSEMEAAGNNDLYGFNIGMPTLDMDSDDEPDTFTPDESFRLFDLTIYNEMLMEGEFGTISLFGDDSSGDPAGRGYMSILPSNIKAQSNKAELRLEAVPEPATMVALGAGLVALAARRRRK